MFCNKCGNQIPDGSRFCSNCGNGATNNFAAPGMSKKEYFKTACSPKAKSLIKAGWTVFTVYAVLSALLLTLMVVGINALLNSVDFDREITEMLEDAVSIGGEDLGISEEELLEFEEELLEFEEMKEEIQAELGMSYNEFIKLIFNVLLGIIIFINFIALLLSFFAVLKKSVSVSIITLIYAILCTANLFIIGFAIFFLVRACILRKEYKRYCEAPVCCASFGGEAPSPAPASAPAPAPSPAQEAPVAEETPAAEEPAVEEPVAEGEASVAEDAPEVEEDVTSDEGIFTE